MLCRQHSDMKQRSQAVLRPWAAEHSWFATCPYPPDKQSYLSIVGEIHRRQRKLLNPVFSTINMRQMTPLFYDTVHRVCRGFYFIRDCFSDSDNARRSFATEFLIS